MQNTPTPTPTPPTTSSSKSRERVLLIAVAILVPVGVALLIWLKSGWLEKIRTPSEQQKAETVEKNNRLHDAIKKTQSP